MQQTTEQILRTHGIRPSVQRLHVYQYLRNRKNHPTVDMIYSALACDIPTLSKTTVYNTLKLFIEHNLVRTLTIENDELRYDADISVHIHFKCIDCGAIHDIFNEFPVKEISLPAGFRVIKTDFCMWGTCPVCTIKK